MCEFEKNTNLKKPEKTHAKKGNMKGEFSCIKEIFVSSKDQIPTKSNCVLQPHGPRLV